MSNRTRTGWLLGLALAFGVTRTAPLGATPAPRQLFVVLSYQLAPELHGCPAEAEFRDSVVAQLGYDPFRAEAAHRVVAELNETDAGLEGRLAWADPNGKAEGERRLSSPAANCREFMKSLAFAMAVQIQLLSATEAEPSTPSPPAPSPPVAVAVPVPAPAPAPPSASARPAESPAALKRPGWTAAVGAGATAELGVLPSLAEGFRLFAALRRSGLAVELAPELTLPVSLRRADGSGFSARSYGVTLAPCLRGAAFAVCGVGAVELLAVHGFGVDDARSPSSLVSKAGLRLAFEPAVSRRWTFGAHLDGLATLTPRTVLLNEVPVWSTPRLALRLGIDLGLLLP